MMKEFLDVVMKLKIPDKGNSFLDELKDKTLSLHEVGNMESCELLIREISERISRISFTPQGYIELPILFFLRAHCHHVRMVSTKNQSIDLATKDTEKAVEKFRVYNSEWNEALAHCYLGLLHYEAAQYDPCHTEYTAAAQILMRLERDTAGTRQYEELNKIKVQLDTIKELTERIEIRNKSSHAMEGTTHKSILLKHKEQLQEHYDLLYANKQRIPPTLVASLFYLYKALIPSHSVYKIIPKPSTDEEKKIYEELFRKIGFFEIIEQLLELEKEYNPTASREKLLNIINQEWDKDVGQQKE
jgi:hypothetical protein